jgi:hypothetical protein
MVIESLETRAMLAGVEPESWSAPGLAPAPLGTGALLSSGVILTCSSPTPGSSGTSSPPAPAAGSGTTSGGDLWDSFSAGSGAGGTTSGSTGGLSTNGPALSSQYTGGSGIGRITPLVYNPESDGPPVFHAGVWTGDDGGSQVVQVADNGTQPPKPDAATASVGLFDWWRNLWRTEAKPATPPVDQPRGADIPAVGLPDQLPATRPDGNIDLNFNSTVEKATPTGIGARAVGEAPKFLRPGVRVLEDIYLDDLGRQHSWCAHYDEFGRLIGRTDWDPRNLPGIPPVHYHTYKWTRGGIIETGTHIPGEYVP